MTENKGIPFSKSREQWNSMIEKLKQFQHQNGHCNVPKPRNYPQDVEFARWVRCQRIKMATLQDLDFFASHTTPTKNKNGKDQNYPSPVTLLVEFKKKHGHCDVPADHPGLGKWVRKIRSRKGTLEKNRPRLVRKLDKLGFDWTVQDADQLFPDEKIDSISVNDAVIVNVMTDDKVDFEFIEGAEDLNTTDCTKGSNNNKKAKKVNPKKLPHKTFMKYLSLLKTFKEKHGHCDVPFGGRDNPSDHADLGRWVQRKRAQREMLMEVHPWKVDLLNDVGFDWSGQDRNINQDIDQMAEED